MPVTLTSGLFPVAQLPAAQVVSVRIFLANLENQPHRATVEVLRLEGNRKERIRWQQLEVPGDERVSLELSSDEVEGETIEVNVTVPVDGFGAGTFPVAPSVAVISLFTGDGTTSLLLYIAADDFAPVSRVEREAKAALHGLSYA